MSTKSPDWQRLADALRAAGADARPRDDCPPAEQIWRAVHLELPLDQRLRIIDHTMGCPSCAEAWRLAMELDRQGATDLEDPPHAASATFQLPGWARLAAALAIVAVGSLLGRAVWKGFQSSDVPRGTPPAVTIRSLLPEPASLSRDAFELQWSGGPPGTRYDVAVTTPAAEIVDAPQGLERPLHRVDPGRLSRFPPGAELKWMVTAHLPDGQVIQSDSFAVRLVR